MDEHEQVFAPQPGEIKKVVVISHSGGRTSTYDNLIDAVTAVYWLDAQLRMAIETAVVVAVASGGAP